MRKKIKLTMLLSFLICLSINSGLNIRSQDMAFAAGEHMFSVCTVDKNLMWICGDRGIIYHSTDGGLNWEKQPTNVAIPLRCISFCNAQVGWVAGKLGTILHTVDGGKTWEAQKTPKTKPLLGIEAVTPEKCWAVGDWGTALYTDDGGKTWQDRTLPEDVVLYDISFLSEDMGWIAGEFGTILYTEDGGNNWTKQNSGIENTLFGVSFRSPLDGLAVGLDGILLKTKDGGNTWEVDEKVLAMQDRGTAKPLFEARQEGDLIVAVGSAGIIMTSSDAGNSWSMLPLPLDMKLIWFRAVELVDDRAVLVGARGTTILMKGEQMTALGQLPSVPPIPKAPES